MQTLVKMLLAGELDCLAVTKCLVKVQAVSADVCAVCGYRLPGFACDVQWHGLYCGSSTGAASFVILITVFWMIQAKQRSSS